METAIAGLLEGPCLSTTALTDNGDNGGHGDFGKCWGLFREVGFWVHICREDHADACCPHLGLYKEMR